MSDMMNEEHKDPLIAKFNYCNKETFDQYYVDFCEHINKYGRDKEMPLLALPTLLTCTLADAVNQAYDLVLEKSDKTHADFYLVDYQIYLKKLNDVIDKKLGQ